MQLICMTMVSMPTEYSKVTARIGSADYELNNGMRANVHSADTLQAEAGTLISTSFDVNSAVLKPYARLAIVHEFTKENDVTINRTNTVSNDFSGSTGKYGLGLDAQITPQATFYKKNQLPEW